MKKFLEDAYRHEFHANVNGVVPYETDQTAIILDETYFYPEGGGQPSDIGWIEAIEIVDVQIKDDIILI